MSAVPYNNSSVGGMYSTSSAMNRTRSTVLLSRPDIVCRCETCTFKLRRLIELSIREPFEPLMIPTLDINYGWWNVRLPSKLLEPVVPLKSAGCVSINDDVMNFLEEKRVINWCPGLRQLHPIRTTGDGNCLMHAVILATCGIQDSGLILRRLVYIALVESTSNSFRERWEKEKQRLNESIPGGLQYTPEEWDKEWSMVVSAAEDLRTKTTMSYEFLEEMHVFVLANVIRRPIIILGESTVRSPLAGDAIEQNNFVGIYLPLLWPPDVCEPNPVVLCFLHNHFQPLISRCKLPSEPKDKDLLAIPLVTSQLEPLHIHFLLPHEESVAHDLLQRYLLTTEVLRKSEDGSSVEAILVAEILYTSLYLKLERMDYLFVMEGIYAQVDAQKIAQGPSKFSSNYNEPGKGDKRVPKTSYDVKEANHRAVEWCPCGKMHHKSKTTQLDRSIGTLENSLGDGYTSKIQFDTSKGYTDKIHKDHSSGHLDIADWNKQLQLKKQTKDLAAGVGQDGRHLAPGVESIPDNVVIFNTLKKLQSPQQTEVGLQTTVPPSTKPGNVKASKTPSAAEKSRIQPRRKLSDISDADVEYIKKKFTVKTPIYCRSLALLGKQCAKPDCNQFLAEETDFCCLVHSRPPNPPPTAVVAKPTTRCTTAGCLNPGLDYYNGLCARCHVYVMLGYSPKYEEEQRSQYSTWYDTPTSSIYKEDRDTKRSVENVKIPLLQQSMTSSSSYGEGLVANKQQKPIPRFSSESVKNLKSGKEKAPTEGSTQPLTKSVMTEKFDPGHFHEFYEKPDSRFIGDDFDDWLDKKYPRKVLGDDVTLPPEPPISKILPFRDNMSVAQDKEKFETKARNDFTKNGESVHGGDKQLTIVKENNKEGGSQENALERSTGAEKAEEASKEDLGNDLAPITPSKTLQLGAKSENCEELSSNDIGSVNAVLVYSREPKKGEWTLPSSAPDLVASGDICCDGEEFPKCLNASCEHVAMDMVAGGYCVACHAVHGLGHTDAQTSGVADDISLVNMPTQETIALCVTEGCCNAVTIMELGLCSVCYAHQLKASTTLQSPLQKAVSSANRYVAKTKETSQSSLSSSGLLTQRATRCLRSSCDRYGDPVYRGYCSQCATQSKNSPMEIDSCC